MKSAIIKKSVLTTKGLTCGTCNHHKDGKCHNDISCGLKVTKNTLGCTHHQDCKIVQIK
jgi:hypothetical protein